MTTKILILALFTCTTFMSCKKDDKPAAKTTQEKLLGKWNYISTESNDYYSGISHPTTYTGGPGEYVDFRNDGKVNVYTFGSYDTVAYGIVSDSKIWMENTSYVYDIKTLTDTELQLYSKIFFGTTDYSEATIKLTK